MKKWYKKEFNNVSIPAATQKSRKRQKWQDSYFLSNNIGKNYIAIQQNRGCRNCYTTVCLFTIKKKAIIYCIPCPVAFCSLSCSANSITFFQLPSSLFFCRSAWRRLPRAALLDIALLFYVMQLSGHVSYNNF